MKHVIKAIRLPANLWSSLKDGGPRQSKSTCVKDQGCSTNYSGKLDTVGKVNDLAFHRLQAIHLVSSLTSDPRVVRMSLTPVEGYELLKLDISSHFVLIMVFMAMFQLFLVSLFVVLNHLPVWLLSTVLHLQLIVFFAFDSSILLQNG